MTKTLKVRLTKHLADQPLTWKQMGDVFYTADERAELPAVLKELKAAGAIKKGPGGFYRVVEG